MIGTVKVMIEVKIRNEITKTTDIQPKMKAQIGILEKTEEQVMIDLIIKKILMKAEKHITRKKNRNRGIHNQNLLEKMIEEAMTTDTSHEGFMFGCYEQLRGCRFGY